MKRRIRTLSAALSLCLSCASGTAVNPDGGSPHPAGDAGDGRTAADAGKIGAADGGTAADLSAPGPSQDALAGSISLTEIRFQAGSSSADVWSVKALLHNPAAPPMTQALGECTVADTSATPVPVRSLDAGDLTISGGPSGDVLLSYDATLGIYAEDLPDPSDDGGATGLRSPLFTATSQLRVEAGGGADIKSISGMWRGVSSLQVRAPLLLPSLPTAGGLPLSWMADNASGNTVQVSLLSDHGTRVTCTSADSGTYTVPQNVLAKVPTGALSLTVSRVYGATAQTDKGPIHLESRSGWQITTQQK